MHTINEKIEENLFYLGFAILILYLSPFFVLGQGAHVLIHDNLDSNVTWLKILIQSGTLFSSNIEPINQIMNGFPRVGLGSEYYILVWLNYFFPPFIAYVINQIMMHFVAYIGMYFLLNRNILPNESKLIIVGTSLCFALLPFWPSGALSVAGQPLALFAFLNIRNNSYTVWDWLIIFILPFFTSFVLSFSFFLSLLICLCLYDFLIHKHFNSRFAFALAIMLMIFLFIENRLVLAMLLKGSFVSHRQEMISANRGVIEALKVAGENFISGQYHAASLQTVFVFPAVVLASFLGFIDKNKRSLLFILFFASLAISLFYGFWQWEGLEFLKNKYLILRSFNFSRFHWLHPLAWYLAFGIALVNINRRHLGGEIVLILLISQIIFSFYNSDFIKERNKNNPTYQEFYSEQLFRDIANFIGKEQNSYRVVSLGIHPSISQYNGFYTLDGYLANYPLSYKHQFRGIIQGELAKSKNLEKYYDEWGSRFYIFSSELEGKGFLLRRDQEIKITHLSFNNQAFIDMGGKYVLSAVEIANSEAIGFVLEKIFVREDSPWCIYLYSVNPIKK